MAAIGRSVLGFRPFTPGRLFDDGDTFDIWHGLAAVHLPGHTAGHSGLYREALKLLICGDFFASYGSMSPLPPAIFNSDSCRIPASVTKGPRFER